MPQLEPISGHYLHLDFKSAAHRVYFERAGQGIPLICLHTAGADGRQYREIINDPRVLEHFEVFVPDMPWHGKSSPPAGWQSTEYRLTADDYTGFVLAFMEAMEISKPVVMGCSIGGRVVLHLALRHAARMRALIGLQSGLHAGADDNSQQTLDHLHHPNIHGGEAATVAVAGLMAPQSPDAHRWETLWHYASGGPGVFRGDLYYYFVDGDLRNQDLRVDTNECPLFLLSGEYDYSAPPSAGREVAARIKGSKFTEMAGLGHFPMSENPDQFKQYLLPVLDEIRAAG